MRLFAVAALIALLPVAPALAQTKPATGIPAATLQSSKQSPKTQPAAPKAPEKRAKSCDEYGVGFKPIEGTGTCVKIGGYVRVQGSGQ
jgi:hypothetical protein